MKYYFSVRRAVPGYEGLYSATTDGRIYSERRKKFLKPWNNSYGYLHITLSKNGKQKQYSVHRLVAMTWIPNPENLPCVNHKDEDKTDNKVSNLEWCTYEYNNGYGTKPARIAAALKIANGIPVYCVELDKVFPSRVAARDELHFRGDLSNYLKIHGDNCFFAGYHWKYVEKGDQS